MAYVLIVVMSVYSGVAVEMKDFDNHAACVKAAEHIAGSYKGRANADRFISATCFPKG